MVSEMREVNRHHYNDKPRKTASRYPKILRPILSLKKLFPHAAGSHQHPLPREQQRNDAVSLVGRSENTIRHSRHGESWRSWITFWVSRAKLSSPPRAMAPTTAYMLNALKRAKGRALGVAFVERIYPTKL